MKLKHILFDFISCPTIEFVIKVKEEEEVYIVEFELDEINRSYHIKGCKVKIWKTNVKRSKLSKALKAFYKIP